MCLCSLVVSPWRYVSCHHDGQRADKKNSEAEGGMNRKDGQKQEGGQVHLNVILIRRPLPFLINKIFVIGKVVVARSRPLGLCVCVCVCGLWTLGMMLTPSSYWPALRKLPPFSLCSPLSLSFSSHPRTERPNSVTAFMYVALTRVSVALLYHRSVFDNG